MDSWDSEHIVGNEEIADNHHFIHSLQCSLTFQNHILIFRELLDLSCANVFNSDKSNIMWPDRELSGIYHMTSGLHACMYF